METKSGGERSVGRTESPVLEVHLGYWLRRVSNQVSGTFARALQVRGTSVAEWVVMCQLEERPGTTPAELAARLEMTRGAISKVVDKLEAKGWVLQATTPEDGRVRRLSLTRKGGRVLPELKEAADRNDREFFDCLEAGERATLRRLLGKLAEVHQIRTVPIE